MEKVYKKSKGSAGLDGIQFQMGLSTVFLLNALRKLEGWRISTENEAAGKFDDIVVEFSDGSAVLLQAKHKDSKRFDRDQLLSDNTKNADFSLPKYFLSYQEIKSKFNVKNIVLCTNANVDKKKLKDILVSHPASSDNILYYENVKKCTFFTISETILPDLKEKTNNYYDKNLQRKVVDREVISDKNLKEFLEKLQLFTGYPSRNQLSRVIDELLSRLRDSKLWRGTSFQEIYGKVEDWFKHKRGEYLNEALAKIMICDIKSDRYCNRLRDYNVSFRYEDFSFTDGKRIFHLNTEGVYVLQVLKTYRALQKRKTLFVDPDEDFDVQKQIVEAFGLPNYEFLVLFLFKLTNQRLVSEIRFKLRYILDKYNYKKVVLIGCKKNMQQIALRYDTVELDGCVPFASLTRQSREVLLKKKIITYQGEDVTLEELMLPSRDEDYDKAVNSEVLENLVKGNKIKVGSRPLGLDEDTARYYVNRTFEREINTADDDIMSSGRKRESFEENQIFDAAEKVVLISDSAGMGKSTVLTHLAVDIKEKYPHLWVIRIELNDYSRFFMDSLKKKKEIITLLELLNSNEMTKTDELEKFVLSKHEKLVLMLDGFDEISPDYTKLVLNLISQCYGAPNFAKIIVTSRPHMSRELQVVLLAEPFLLRPFTIENQIDFLTRYWAHSLELEPEDKCRCVKYATALINKMSSWINTRNTIAAIPLQVRMLAEIFQENTSTEWEGCKKFLDGEGAEPILPKRMKIIKLYEMFIDRKLNIFLDKANPSGTAAVNNLYSSIFAKCFTNYQSMAFKVVLNTEIIQDERMHHIFSRFHYDDSIETDMLKIGIVQKTTEELEFTHRTFAEYFVARSILDISELSSQSFIQDVYFQVFFIDVILCNPQYTAIRAFLESVIEDVEKTLPSNIFENYRCASINIKFNKHRSYLIHSLANEGCLAILRLLSKCIGYNLGKLDIMTTDNHEGINTLDVIRRLVGENGLNIKDQMGNTPLHYASNRGFLNMVMYLVGHGDRNIMDDLKIRHGIDLNSIGYQGFTALHIAAGQGHLDVVRFLQRCGANTDIRNEEDFTPLHSAAERGHLDVVKYLKERGQYLDVHNERGFTPLHLASLNGHLNVVKYLAEGGDDINLTEKHGFNALHLAALRRHLDVVNYLTGLGLDINKNSDSQITLLGLGVRIGDLALIRFLVYRGADISLKIKGVTLLSLAADCGHTDVCRFLIKCGADVNVASNVGHTPLHSASVKGHLKLVKFFVECSARINARDANGFTALHAAAEAGHLGVVKLLIESGAHVNIANNGGCTGLHAAAGNGHLDVVKFLVKSGGQVNTRNMNGATAIHLAAQEGHLSVIQYLVECGADDKVEDSKGITALHVASAKGHLEIVRFLIKRKTCGAHNQVRCVSGDTPLRLAIQEEVVRYPEDSGQYNNGDSKEFTTLHIAAQCGHLDMNNERVTALHLASAKGHLDIVRLLIQYGFNVNASAAEGITPLRLAVCGHLDTVKFLLECGALTNVKDNFGFTPLHVATQNGYLEIVKCLVGASAQLDVGNNDGFTALHIAAMGNFLEIVKFLIKCGACVDVRINAGYTAVQLAAAKGHAKIVRYFEECGAHINVENSRGAS